MHWLQKVRKAMYLTNEPQNTQMQENVILVDDLGRFNLDKKHGRRDPFDFLSLFLPFQIPVRAGPPTSGRSMNFVFPHFQCQKGQSDLRNCTSCSLGWLHSTAAIVLGPPPSLLLQTDTEGNVRRELSKMFFKWTETRRDHGRAA